MGLKNIIKYAISINRILQQLQEFVIKMLLNIHQGVSTTPYDESACKISLYKTLTTFVTNHHWNFSPPIEYTIFLLSKGQFDENPEVSFYCSSAIANLNNFIHPSCGTLQFPVNVDDLKRDLNAESSQQGGEKANEEVMDIDECELIDDDIEEIVCSIEPVEKVNTFIPEEPEILEIDNKTIEDESDENDSEVVDEEEQNLKIVENNTKSKEAIEISDEEIIAIFDDKINEKKDLIKDDKTTEKVQDEIIDLEEDNMLTSFVNIIN